MRAAQAGLAKYFPAAHAVILNSDGGSTDGTPDIVAGTAGPDAAIVLVVAARAPVHRFSVPYHGLPGKGSAFRTIFRAAELLGGPGLRRRRLGPAQHHARVDPPAGRARS